MPESTLDYYGNKIDQLPTPTTLLLKKREQTAEIETKGTRYKATLPLWKVDDVNRLMEIHNIEKQAQIFLKDQPKEKRFTLELTIKEDKYE
jgi:hypothetical protein